MRRSLLVVVCLATCAACSSSGSSSGSGAKAPASASASPSTAASAAAAGSATATISSNWTAFFSAKTPEAQRISLLQNGTALKPLVDTGLSSPLASSLGVSVSKVVQTDATTATVTYSLTLAGKPVLADTTGTAVLDGGTWKVSAAAFCTLATLENGGKAPGACASSTPSPASS